METEKTNRRVLAVLPSSAKALAGTAVGERVALRVPVEPPAEDPSWVLAEGYPRRWCWVSNEGKGWICHGEFFPAPVAAGERVAAAEKWRRSGGGVPSWPPYEYEADYLGVRHTGEWEPPETMPADAIRLFATALDTPAPERWCEECQNRGLRGVSWTGVEVYADRCPHCRGEPDQWVWSVEAQVEDSP